MLDTFVTWLQSTSLSQAIVFNTWIWPACETLHFVGLALLMGSVGLFDLRLIGFFRQISVGAARDLMPFAIAGFAVNLATGLVFLIGHPEQYVHNVSWWWKVASLMLAGLNAVVFEIWVGARVVSVGAGEDTPAVARTIGGLSMLAWLGVLYFGRMLPFIGNAY